MITYNHAQWIACAIDSILAQQFTDFEIVIGDDCSTDGTSTIIRSYQEKFPQKIRLLLRKQNLGMVRNFRQTLDGCSGDYIAFLEGDDYWTDPRKLELQTKFLDENPGCALCHHTVDHVSCPGEQILKQFPPNRYRKQRPSYRNLAIFNFIQTCSVVFRRSCLPALDERYENLKLGDWPLFVLLSERGWIGFLNQNMAAYRLHVNNSWNHRPPDYKIKAMEAMAWYLLGRVRPDYRRFWEDTILALAFKDLLITLRSTTASEVAGKAALFIKRSREFKKPLWMLNGLWAYCRAYRG